MKLQLGWPAAGLLLLATALQAVPHKRSLSALARTSQLPHSSSAPADQAGHDQDGSHSSQHDKRSELQEEAIREELLRQRAAPAAEALIAALMAADQYGADNGVEDKRSVSSLARHGNLPASPDKRSLEALARSGLLSKNSRVDSSKRSVSTLARAGELPGKRWIPPHQRVQPRNLLDELERELAEEKRSLSSLARSGGLSRPGDGDSAGQNNFPYSIVEQQVKRSLESLARNWNLPEALQAAPKRSAPYGAFDDDLYWVKRNAAALLRQSKLPNAEDSQQDDGESGRQQAQQGSGRRKRSPWYEEVPEQDWEPSWDPQDWTEDDSAPLQKRFLGRIPNMGRHRQKTNEDSSPRRRRPH